ncbi:MAG: glycosyltransferase family 2 protein [Opitutaceae bacterium]
MIRNDQSGRESRNSPSKGTVGVVAICYNEERDLPGFLECLLPWVDEIVLVDDNSTDQTAAIAKAAGSKVTFLCNQRSEEDGFAGQRNLGLERISTDWVLNMDIDERVDSALRDEILSKIQRTQLNGFRYRRINYFLHRQMKAGGWDSWNRPQLARRGSHKYVGRVHEACEIDGGEAAIGQLSAAMLHFNDESYSERMRKSMQYCQLEADKLIERKHVVSALQIVIRPIIEFGKKYIIRQGFKDGVPGLISAAHAACATFRMLALTWDEQNRIPRERLEEELNQND